MPGSHLIAVLVFLYFFVINKMGDINEHSAGIDFAATDILVKRGENLVDLDRKSARFCLALTLSDGLFPQLAQILTADGCGKLNLFHGLTQGAVFNQKFQVHFGLALELGNALQEAFAIDAYSTAQRFIGVKNRAKTERQHRGALKAFADHMCMLEQGFLTEIAGGNVLAYQDGKVAAGVREYLGVCYTLRELLLSEKR